jgi:catechol 2,3-dioxygenase-like lactoylglutathione lyase family enzyme
MHVNVSVTDLDASIAFYKSLFACEPAVVKQDYAKWMLDDPRVNFAITTRGERKGIDHLGIQVESERELDEVYARLETANAPIIEEGETTCCYANSEKSWIFDPDSIAWETFLTRGESPVYGSDLIKHGKPQSTCCTPTRAAGKPGSGCC